jgi:hypothetical protein
MEFTLFYKGDLPISKKEKSVIKQQVRRSFHPQLKLLWQQPPLINSNHLLNPDSEITLIFDFAGFMFAPLVSKRLFTIAELDILLLRPGSPGKIIKSGDVDNRLKIIIDSLKMPKQRNELPQGDIPGDGETPFYCLLEDDNLITKISIDTSQLLDDSLSSSHVVLLINVLTKVTHKRYGDTNFV